MSRITRYQDSFKKYITEKNILNDLFQDKTIKYYFDKYYNEDNLNLPILLLTILNSQNKKNKISFHGYPFACGIYLLYVAVNILNNEELTIEGYRVINILIVTITKFIYENVQKINKKISSDKVNQICLEIFKSIEETLGINGILTKCIITNHTKCDTSIKNYFKKHDNNIYIELFKKKFIKKESLDNIINQRLGSICYLGIKIAWILGNGIIKEKELKRIKKLSKNFAFIFQISNDFKNLTNRDTLQNNYVINCGFSSAYQEFLKNKQEFIEESMVLNILSITVKEILDNIESNMDSIIDDTTQEIKSSLINF